MMTKPHSSTNCCGMALMARVVHGAHIAAQTMRLCGVAALTQEGDEGITTPVVHEGESRRITDRLT